MTQHEMMRKPRMISGLLWVISFNAMNVEPRVKLYMPKEESFLIPTKHIDVIRKTHTSLDVMMVKILMIIGTYVEKENYQMHRQASQDLCC